MNLILNRNFELPADGWYQLAPLGEFPHAAAGVTQVIDEAACARMVSAFETVKNASGNFPGLLIDFDHFSLDAAKHSEAAGWITDLKFISPTSNSSLATTHNPHGGLYANIRWSDVGETAVRGGRYRFLSPVWAKSDCEDLGNDRLRPVRLLNAAVTNDPNLKGILPLSNSRTGTSATRHPTPGTGSPFDFSPLARNTNKEIHMQPVIDALLNKLNLPADTAEADLIAAIENMATADEVAALTNRAETAESSLADQQAAQLEADADAFCEANAALIENRDEVRARFIENRELTEAVFKNLKTQKPAVSTAADSRRPLHNRDSKVAATRNRDASASESRAVKIRNRAAEIMKAEGIVYTDAFRRAEQEFTD
ncbi:MAG: phage protease [Kiritimatiellales bacterium]|nr:phage protease [Kiritimatiellales bacterium]